MPRGRLKPSQRHVEAAASQAPAGQLAEQGVTGIQQCQRRDLFSTQAAGAAAAACAVGACAQQPWLPRQQQLLRLWQGLHQLSLRRLRHKRCCRGLECQMEQQNGICTLLKHLRQRRLVQLLLLQQLLLLAFQRACTAAVVGVPAA